WPVSVDIFITCVMYGIGRAELFPPIEKMNPRFRRFAESGRHIVASRLPQFTIARSSSRSHLSIMVEQQTRSDGGPEPTVSPAFSGSSMSSLPLPGGEPSLPQVHLKISRRSSHPWIFQKMVERPAARIRGGSVVDILDRDGRWVGRGFYNGHSRIALRIL